MHQVARDRRRGFTLIELMIAMVVFGIVLNSVVLVLARNQRLYIEQRTNRRAEEALRAALAVAGQVVQNAGARPFSAVFVTIEPNPMASAAWDNVRIRSDFAPADNDVTDFGEDVRLWVASDTMFARWTAAGPAEPVAAPVRSLAFAYFAANGTQITVAGSVATQAVRVRITAVAPAGPANNRLIRRSMWVYLRNRT